VACGWARSAVLREADGALVHRLVAAWRPDALDQRLAGKQQKARSDSLTLLTQRLVAKRTSGVSTNAVNHEKFRLTNDCRVKFRLRYDSV